MAKERSNSLSAGSSSFWATSNAARCTAEGNTSLEDWPMLTWSLACTFSPASVAITSLAFMFVEVPEPVWNTSIGNCSSCLPAAISPAAFSMRAARRLSSSPSSPLTAAAAPFTRASQRTTDTGTVSPEIGKFATALAVSPPQSCLSIIGSPRVGGRVSISSAEGHELPCNTHRVVVGHQKARPGKHAQLPTRQQSQCLFRAGQRMHRVVVGPQQQHRHVELGVELEQLCLGASRPAPRALGPRSGEIGVTGHVAKGVAHQVPRLGSVALGHTHTEL